MRRFFLVPLFAFGALAGFGSEFHHARGACHWQDRQAQYEQHVADVCTTAALNAAQRSAPAVVAAPQPAPAAPAAAPSGFPANVPVVIVNTLPQIGGVAAPAPQPYFYPPQYAPPAAPQYALPAAPQGQAPVQYQLVPVPAAQPAPAGK